MASRRSSTAAPSLPSTTTCADVRDRLPDFVLGALIDQEERLVSRHLEWCAGCRKELAELEEGVAAVGLALEPVAPPMELEQKVLERVSEAAGASARERRRFRIVTAIAVLATFFGIASLGWAAVVSGRLERLQNDAAAAESQAAVLRGLLDTLGGQQILPARLSPTEGHQGGGQAIVYRSAEQNADWVLVIAGGLAPARGPYQASLVHGSGIEVPLGELYAASDGRVFAYRLLRQDLTGFERVIVTDRQGRVVLRGPILTAGG